MRLPVIALVLVASVACSNKLGGDLTINGEPFAPASCRNGVVYGFSGVEVRGKRGDKLRLAQTATGEVQVIVFAPGATVGSSIGTCGTITVDTQRSTINDVKNVRGKATLACETDGLTLAGTVTFENCH
ncbi:MAG: hypothetical protein R3B06_02785 [Kofleriaceae bacterium]